MKSADGVIERIREVRRQLTREVKGDSSAYCERIRAIERRHPEKMVSAERPPVARQAG